LHRGLVDPLSIVDKPDDRLLSSCGRYQLQGGDTDEESLRRSALSETERLIQNVPVQRREFCVVAAEWPAKLLQAGVRELHLGLDATGPADAEVIDVLGQAAEQRRLPDAGFPSKHENASPALSSPVQEGGELSLFPTPSQQLMVGGTESQGTVVIERGMLAMIATHRGTQPPKV
jgi:hypothetical protein